MIVMPANYSAAIVHYWAGAYPGKIGWLVGPTAATKTKIRPWIPYAADNDAWGAHNTGKEWDELAFLAHLEWLKKQPTPPLWVVVPDVVADAAATLRNWLLFSGVVASYGFALAFAVQDGMTPADVPENADVVFVGGSTTWKWRTVAMWARSFPRVHVGRVNTDERLWYCHDLNIESCDGTGLFREPKQVERLGRFLAGIRSQQTELFSR